MDKNTFQYTQNEELVNVITHFMGLLISIYFLLSLLYKSIQTHSWIRITSSSTYGVALIFLFISSSLYHHAKTKKLKIFFKRLDHSCIYIVIAASYTPYILHHFEQSWRGQLLVIVWLLAIIGIIYKMVAKKKRPILSLGTYMAFGVLFFVISIFVKIDMSPNVFKWFLYGGGFYISGAIIYSLKRITYHHGLWHIFVIMGVASHYQSLIYSIGLR